MTEAEKLKDLIARLEAADGPDREIDAAISYSLLADPSKCMFPDQKRWVAAAVEQRWNVPRFTASLDAALTLMPKGALWSIVSMETVLCRIIPARPGGGYLGASEIVAHAWEPELATCAAALRVRYLTALGIAP